MKQRYLVLAMLCVLGVILYIDRVCISVALPSIQADLGLEPEQLGWISFAFSLSYAAFEIPSGHLGDRYGSRRALARITLWWSVFTALTGAALGLWSLLMTRFLFGAGEAGAWPNATSVISKWFPIHRRGAAMGWFGGATAAGGALAPLLVIPLQHAYGWRAAFVVFAVVGAVWAAVWMLWFRDSPREMKVSAAELAELGVVQPLAADGMPWRVALRESTIWGLAAMAFADIYAAFFGIFWMPTFLVKARGFTDDDLKWTSLSWVAAILGNIGGGAFSDALVTRFGRARGRRLVGAGGMLVVAAALLVAAHSNDKWITLGAFTVCGLMWGMIQTNAFATCIDVGGRRVGTVAGCMNTGAQIGGALSAVLFGYLVKTSGSYDVPVVVMAAVSAVGAAAWGWIDAGRPIGAASLAGGV